MTINIFVLKGDLNAEKRSGAFLFLSGIQWIVPSLLFQIKRKIPSVYKGLISKHNNTRTWALSCANLGHYLRFCI